MLINLFFLSKPTEIIPLPVFLINFSKKIYEFFLCLKINGSAQNSFLGGLKMLIFFKFFLFLLKIKFIIFD